ncbi:hypothetical protein FRC12_020500 [Ceratobasidium sp. 428]|nr:hypothetical protein FRC12_020500 [Ceratobasidium sp. 428]
MCSHHDEDPEGDRHNNIPFPIARRYRQQVAGKGIVDAYMEHQRKRLQKYLLAKLGIHVFNREEGTVLVTGWNSLIDHERAHIVAAYFRRVIFNESHLFVQAHFHTSTFKDRAIELPEIMTLEGEALDLAEEIGASMFCMITFLLNPSLSVSDLEFLCDYVTWPAVVEVRVAAQDVILDVKTFEATKQRSGRPYWAHLIQPDVLKRNSIKPEGALPILCGTLYEASYYQTLRPNTFKPRFWSHIASLVRCGTCLFSLIQSSRQWCDLVRVFAVHRVPLYGRRLPHTSGLVPEDFWCTDRACDDIRGGLLRRCLETSGQAPLGRYRLDELLEMAGVTMLGIVEGGPVDTRGITKAVAVRYMQTFTLLPQVWFTLPTSYDPAAKSLILSLVARSRLPDAEFTMHASMPNDPAMTRAVNTAPRLMNVLRRQPDTLRWQPDRVDLSQIHLLARMKRDPVPPCIASDTCLVEIAYKHSNSTGVEPILELLLNACMAAYGAPTVQDLALELEHKLEHDLKLVARDHTGAFTYAFDIEQIKPLFPVDGPDELDEVQSQDSATDAPPLGSLSSAWSHENSSPSPLSPTSVAIPVPAAVENANKSPSVPFSPNSSIPVALTHETWDDLMYLEDDKLPDLSEWGVTLPHD